MANLRDLLGSRANFFSTLKSAFIASLQHADKDQEAGRKLMNERIIELDATSKLIRAEIAKTNNRIAIRKLANIESERAQMADIQANLEQESLNTSRLELVFEHSFHNHQRLESQEPSTLSRILNQSETLTDSFDNETYLLQSIQHMLSLYDAIEDLWKQLESQLYPQFGTLLEQNGEIILAVKSMADIEMAMKEAALFHANVYLIQEETI
jgi:hypothetical protein